MFISVLKNISLGFLISAYLLGSRKLFGAQAGLILHGAGVQQAWFNDNAVGDHMQLAGTLAEIIGPAGFTYAALQSNMFENQDVVFNHRLCAAEF